MENGGNEEEKTREDVDDIPEAAEGVDETVELSKKEVPSEKKDDDEEEKEKELEAPEEEKLSGELQKLNINPEENEQEESKSDEEVIPEPEIEETVEEKLKRIKEFYDVEFARPDLEPHGPKNSYIIIKYENYHKPFETIPEQRENPKKRVEMNEGNAKIAEYFGEDLNSDEEFDQLLKQFTETAVNEGTGDKYPKVGSEQSEGDGIKHIPEVSKEKQESMRVNEKATFPTIMEENENQMNIDSPSPLKHKEKSKAEKRKKNNELISSKVHIRHLPPNMRKEEFLEAIGTLPEYNYFHFTSGAFMSRVCNRKCTGFCHINFVKQEDADAFVSSYRIFIIRDERGDECFGSAEFAINQRLPKIPAIIKYDSGTLYDMPKDLRYEEFKQRYDANITGILGVPVNQDGSVTADVMMNEIEERNTHKNELQTTPLLAYIIAQAKSEKDKKFGHSLKKTSEKSRITIKKERKRDRRDRRERKEKEKDKVRSTKDKDGDHKPEAKDSAKQSDKKIKKNSEKPRKSDNMVAKSEAATKEKDSQSETKHDSGEKRSNSDVTRDKADADSKKDRKLASPPKKYEKRNNEKRSFGGGKPEAASSTSKPLRTEKTNTDPKISNSEPPKTGNSNVAGNSTVDQDKSGVKKKTVKKIVKVKKVIKKGDDTNIATSKCVQEKKEASSAKTSVEVQPKTKSAEGNKTDSGAAQPRENSSSAQNDSKRTKKARPDMQIYRPGSLRNKVTDTKAGAGDNTLKKEKDKTNEVKLSSTEGKSSDKLKHGDS